MIDFIRKPNTDEEIFRSLGNIPGKWFKEKFGKFSEAQKYSILQIKGRKNILVSSPTGSGKTLCAFISILDYLISLDEKGELENKVYAVYVSPLKALTRDIEVNLKMPLEEMEKIVGKKFNISISVRTGDTTSVEKSKMLKKAPHILITTPESLAIVLSSSKFIELLKAVEFVIVDEIHALASNKRGVHLNLSIERLNDLSLIKPTRIGLSATIAPIEEIARYLVGYEDGKERECIVADVQFLKKADLKVLCPVNDLIDTTAEDMHSGLYGLIDKLVQEHKTTLIFTNTRSATERVINHLKEMFPSKYLENIGAHHSSLSKNLRFDIEQRLREGKLKVVVTSTSLELGIDIGFVDLVILLGSPKSVARALQRAGRAGHKLHDKSKARFIVLDRDDLVECSVLLKEAIDGKIDRIHIPKNCLDVLSQQIYGMAIQQKWNIDKMLSVIRSAYCYHNLNKDDFFSVISYLAGEYSLEEKNVYAKIWYDSDTKEIGKRGKLARVIYMTNVGTIPEESYINVKIAAPADRREELVGKIDESFLERMKKGDVFVLGGNKYQFMYSRGMNAYVNASVQKSPTIPSWFSEMLPLSFDLACSIQHFRKLINEKFDADKKDAEIKEFIKSFLYVDENSVDAIYNYFYEQYNYAKMPDESRLLIEHFSDKKKHYVIFHTLYGRRVNDALSRAIAYLVAQERARDVELGISDNGFFLASPDKMQAEKALKLLDSKNIEDILEQAVEKTEVFNRRFRHCAARSLMILRNYKGKNKTAGKMHLKSGFLLGAIKKISREFPILRETKREVLEDLMDIENTRKVLDWIKDSKIKIETINLDLPSPFAFNLIMQGYTDLMKIESKIDFLKRMHKAVLKSISKV